MKPVDPFEEGLAMLRRERKPESEPGPEPVPPTGVSGPCWWAAGAVAASLAELVTERDRLNGLFGRRHG